MFVNPPPHSPCFSRSLFKACGEVVLGGEGEISKLAPTLPINTSSNRLPPSDSHCSKPASQPERGRGKGGRGKGRGDCPPPPFRRCVLLCLGKESAFRKTVFSVLFFLHGNLLEVQKGKTWGLPNTPSLSLILFSNRAPISALIFKFTHVHMALRAVRSQA